MVSKKGEKRVRVLLLLAAAPVVLYFVFFFLMAVNIPFGDDYPVLAFVLNFTNPHWPGEKFALLFSQHNEHRIVTLRLLLLGFFYLAGKINFKLISFLGNLFFLGLAYVLFKAPASKERVWPLCFVPVLFLLFQPQHHQLTVWAMCAYTNVLAVFLSFLALYLIVGPSGSRAFPGAILCSVLAAYTNGNGVFVFFIGIFALLLIKKYRRLLIWLLAGSVYVGLYFYGFVRNPATPDILPYLKIHFFQAIGYFLSILGAFSDFGVFRPYFTVLAGLVILAGLLFLLKKKLYRMDLFLFSAILFVFLSMAALAWTRAAFGVEQSFTSRYKFTSVMMLILVYLSILRLAKEKRRIIVGFLAFSVVFNALSFYRNFSSARTFRNVFVFDLLKWNAGRTTLAYANPEQAEIILRLAVKRRIYEPPFRLDRLEFPFGAIDQADGIAVEHSQEIVFTGWALDDSGAPTILVRRSPLPSDGEALINRGGKVYLGRALWKQGTVPAIAQIYYGFPNLNRVTWEFHYKPDLTLPPEKQVTLYFFAIDRVGHESLLGQRNILFSF